MTINREGREDRLRASIATSDELKPLLGPGVQGFFDSREKALINKMISAPAADDDARRGASLELAALRQLRAWIASGVRRGTTDATKLEELQNAE